MRHRLDLCHVCGFNCCGGGGSQRRGRALFGDLHLFLGHMEGHQVQQVVIGGMGLHREQPCLGFVARQVLDAAQAGDVAEQLLDGFDGLQHLDRADLDAQVAHAAGHSSRHRGGCGHGGSSGCRGRRHRCDHRGRRRHHGRGAIAGGQPRDALHQIGGGHGLALAARLVARQQAARGIRRLQQHIHHFRHRGDFMAAQTVQQRLHLVRQLGHVGETEGRRSPLDRVGTTENAVELFVIGCIQVQIQQHLLHLVEVLPRLFEEDLVELGQIEIRL